MRKSGWILATSILFVGFGFGHAGCYTCGLPGGMGAGGQSSQPDAGGSSNLGEDDSGTDGDSGDAASNVAKDCVDSRDCSDGGVCDPISSQCVGCIGDVDCNPSTQRCANHECLDIVKCNTDKLCTPIDQICDTVKGYCVDCLGVANCVKDETCVDGLCI